MFDLIILRNLSSTEWSAVSAVSSSELQDLVQTRLFLIIAQIAPLEPGWIWKEPTVSCRFIVSQVFSPIITCPAAPLGGRPRRITSHPLTTKHLGHHLSHQCQWSDQTRLGFYKTWRESAGPRVEWEPPQFLLFFVSTRSEWVHSTGLSQELEISLYVLHDPLRRHPQSDLQQHFSRHLRSRLLHPSGEGSMSPVLTAARFHSNSQLCTEKLNCLYFLSLSLIFLDTQSSCGVG